MEGIPGQRLLHDLIDEIAILDEGRIFTSIPISDDPVDGFIDITYDRFAVAIDRTAWWLQKSMRGRPRLETFAYLGRNDLRYQLLIIAAIKTCYKILLPSVRNSSYVQTLLLDKTDCRTVIYDSANRNIGSAFENVHDLKLIPMPDLDTLLDERAAVEPYPKIAESHNDALKRPFMVLHSSGSTGDPKPIVYTLQSIMTEDAHRALEQTEGKLWYHELEERVWFQLILPVYYGIQVVWGPANVPLNPDIAARVIMASGVNGAVFPSSILEAVHETQPSALFESLDFVFSAGSPLAIPVGDSIAALTRLHNFIGYSEATAPPRYLLESTEWKYHHFHPASGFRAEPVGDGSDLYELVIIPVRSQTQSQSVFLIFPNLEEYRTKDLISKHPTKPHLWLHRGRLDDLILLSNGEKVDPHATEALLHTSPYIRSALIYGTARTHCALLVELQPQVDQVTAVDLIWPLVQDANTLVPSHAQIDKDMILIAQTSKLFCRAGKGSVQRKLTFNSYEKELAALYNEPSDDSHSQSMKITEDGPNVDSLANIVFSISGIKLQPHENIFTAGVDSRHVVSFLRRVTQLWFPTKSSSSNTVSDLGVRIVYNNPTLDRLSVRLQSLLNGTLTDKTQLNIPEPKVDLDAIIGSLLPKIAKAKKETVLVTGGTGSLGSTILKQLLMSSRVGTVWCLVRLKDAAIAKFKDMALPSSDKLHVLQSNLSYPGLGLDHVHYQDILQTVDTIIHCAWNVNFNHTLDTYMKTDVAGVLNLIDLSLQSRKGVNVIFTSSIAAVANWDTRTGPVPEEIIHDKSVTAPSGYGQSKYIAEHLLDNAAKKHGIPVTIIRIGQIAGSLSGNDSIWNKHEWFPMLLQASKNLGVLPKELGADNVVDWVPIDVLADAIVEVSITSHRGRTWPIKAEVIHAVNPHAVSWSDLSSAVLENISGIAKDVPYAVWIAQLKNLGQRTKEGDLSWMSLLEWFQDFEKQKYPAMSVARAVLRSGVMRGMEPISGAAMQKWIKEWDTMSHDDEDFKDMLRIGLSLPRVAFAQDAEDDVTEDATEEETSEEETIERRIISEFQDEILTLQELFLLVHKTRGLGFYKTGKGLFALLPQVNRPGDFVWILKGCRLPVLLRPSISHGGSYEFVGGGYVYGIMNGEMLEKPEFGWQEVSLR
ncbi:NRPS-like enzyme [Fusarium denticulatum]|uniref:NRPS-like enzyme n=1 Tax=Fusarium denticulatum TaxID=48507 RepID=A0A8H5X969_9HYPO|nr:NRPS-like enzyme [Fusarium denticulatum]